VELNANEIKEYGIQKVRSTDNDREEEWGDQIVRGGGGATQELCLDQTRLMQLHYENLFIQLKLCKSRGWCN
jgi:hypothetical protein